MNKTAFASGFLNMPNQAFTLGYLEKLGIFNPFAKKQSHYYVDAQCVDCDLCREIAPANFKRNAANGESYVSRQPSNASEEAVCLKALKSCPVEAIVKIR